MTSRSWSSFIIFSFVRRTPTQDLLVYVTLVSDEHTAAPESRCVLT